ncbi:MAG: hypothetical protein QM486_04230 [Flavobacteriaceae bacterium]
MENQSKKATKTFKIIAIVALIWNLMGVFAYLGQVYLTDEAKALLPQENQDFYAHVPAWYTSAFAIAVFAGALGCLTLLLRKPMAKLLLLLSLIGVLIQSFYSFFIQTDMPISVATAGGPIVIILVSIFLVWYSRKELV